MSRTVLFTLILVTVFLLLTPSAAVALPPPISCTLNPNGTITCTNPAGTVSCTDNLNGTLACQNKGVVCTVNYVDSNGDGHFSPALDRITDITCVPKKQP